ncbi:rubrerythrin [Natranaerofaba carboxydovora]|uniref:rubrerythrin n=1 Tax=Natranaerofaba carboxydovora TaxID=2742683 RepID=UPI001F13814F|nr:ferritin family protein [Natranaerofaba carboxydovora]UMZ74249.1 Rubrerythrin [Natranaerofaba carboxydovora]
MSIKGTKTEKNLLTAFAGESQARNRYDYYASQASKEGYEQIAAVFEETAKHERAHAKRLFKFLEGGEAEIQAYFPAGIIGTTEENLKESANGENHEHAEMYPEFAEVAKEEGFKEIASVFENIAIAEKYHEERFLGLLNNLKENKVYEKPEEVTWRCRNCGFNITGKKAPQVCPACDHPQKFFEMRDYNW